jgi:DNA repair exonuclease SbcCD ATPase subunit
MKEIIIKTLKIRNFKGIRLLDVDFAADVTSIYGSNATGKTTVADAFFWLLFDKDSAGRTDFTIKPLAANGEVANHGETTSVEGAIEVDGVVTTYRKTLREKWTRRRGNDAQVYDGNETERFIDDLPVKKYDYDAAIAKIVSEDIFREITSTTFFSQTLSQLDRRKRLFEMTSAISDEELIQSAEEFSDLLPLIEKHKTIDNVKLIKTRERKSLNQMRDDIPTRIDEAMHQAETLAAIDFAELESKQAAAKIEVDRAQEKLIATKNFTQPTVLQNELAQLENDYRSLELENREYRAAQAVPIDTRTLTAGVTAEKQRLQSVRNAVARTDAELHRLREEFEKLSSKPIEVDDTCPTCGRKYEPQHIEQAQNAIRQHRNARLDEINQRGKELKALLADSKSEEAATLERLETAEAELEAATKSRTEVKDAPGYEEKANELKAKIAEKQAEIQKHTDDFAALLSEAEHELAEKKQAEAEIAAELAKRGIIAECERRITELREQAQKISAELEEVDMILNDIDDFVRYKVAAIEDSINALFTTVSFKLFKEQVNGALAECCEATVNGVPYSDLNSAAKINAGIDIINAISDFYGVCAPIFIDNAESTVNLAGTRSQLIRLVVSAEDERIRVA